MAIITTQPSQYNGRSVTNTQIMCYAFVTAVNKETGLVTLKAEYDSSSEDAGLSLELFEGPESQANEILDEIRQVWTNNEAQYEIPEARALTIDEERELFNSIYDDGRKKIHAFQEKAYGKVIVRIKSERDVFNMRDSNAQTNLRAFLDNALTPENLEEGDKNPNLSLIVEIFDKIVAFTNPA